LATINDEEYQALATKYNAAATSTERDALLKQANEKMDQVMELFARIVALTDGKPEAKQINDSVRQNLESYYKYRHKNLDGLPDLINKYKK
jgi:acyl-CoA reductase-like NAD-dependent aldehyde dehydrogenase